MFLEGMEALYMFYEFFKAQKNPTELLGGKRSPPLF